MARLSERIKFEVEYPSGIWTQVSPVNEDYILSKKRERGQFFYRLEFETPLIFSKDESWDFISDIELNDHCADLNLRVTCPMEGGITLYEGKVKLSKGEFNFSICQAIVTPQTEDDYTCLNNGLKQEINVLSNISVTDRKTLYLNIGGALEYAHCPGVDSYVSVLVTNPSVLPENTDCLTELDGWVLLENHFRFIDPVGLSYPKDAEYNTIWVRQRVTSVSEPPGGGWTNIGGDVWVRSPELDLDYDETSPYGFGEEDTFDLVYKPRYADKGPIDNGFTLAQCLEKLLAVSGINCPLTVSSNFFSINPDGVYPANDAYTKALEFLGNVLIFQKSDVKRWDAVENATVAKLKLEELFEWLAAMFKVFPSVESGLLRLEHISYYESKPVLLDLTLSSYAQWVAGKYKYSYRQDKNPLWERFEWMDDAYVSAFMRSANGIQYGAACANLDNSEEKNIAGRVTTDLSAILNNAENFQDDGFVFVAAVLFDGNYYAVEQVAAYFAPFLTTTEYLNGHLSFRSLIFHYHRWYAYQYDAAGEAIETPGIESIRPNKDGEPISITGWCCSDFIDFEPDSRVRTPIGDGEVEKITYSVKNGKATFELSYT